MPPALSEYAPATLVGRITKIITWTNGRIIITNKNSETTFSVKISENAFYTVYGINHGLLSMA